MILQPSSLAELLGLAVQPEGRVYPRWAPSPDMGDVFPPSGLPNPYGIKHRDPIEQEWIRPQTTRGPEWRS